MLLRLFPLKKLSWLRMKRMCGVVFCFVLTYVATASLIAGRISGQVVFQTGAGDFTNLTTLKQVHVIFRHGDRTPIERYPKDPYDSRKYWPEGWGKLTNIGKLMHYQLGQYIRQRYNGFLTETYTSDQIYVQSSDKDRTIQSAMANLAGMWPPLEDTSGEKFGDAGIPQFVPVHTVSAQLDNKLAFTASCPRYERLSDSIPSIPSEKAFDTENANFYRYLTNNTGLNVISYHNVSELYDILFVQKSHNLKLPPWTVTVFPDKMRVFAERWLKATFFNDEMLRLHSGPLITQIARNMKRALGNPTDLEKTLLERFFGVPDAKFYVYSAHDTTVAPMLAILDAFDGKYPPYASSLYFELHNEHPSDENKAFVKVFYRPQYDKPSTELKLVKCQTQPCRFNDFFDSIQQWILDEKQWASECHL